MNEEQQPDKKQSTLDEWLSRKKKSQINKGIQPIPEGQRAPLSYGQERLWLLDQLYANKSLYNYAHWYQLIGPLVIENFVKAFQQLAERHLVILSNYELKEESIEQRVTQAELPVEHTDLSNLSPREQKVVLAEQRSELMAQVFDLAADPLMKLYIFKLTDERFEVLVVLHHILGDAWSLSIINKEVSQIYQALSGLGESTIWPLKIQYKDYAYWQRQQKIKTSNLSYWKNKLQGELPIFNLPKQDNFKGESFQGQVFKKQIDPVLSLKLKELAKNHSTTMYVLMLTAYKILISRYTNQTDVIVGSPFSNRDTPQLEGLIGFFNETLVLRTEMEGSQSFDVLVERVKETTMEALAHKDIPFDLLVNELKPDRQAGENPLFQTMFLYNAPGAKLDLGSDIGIEEEMLDLGVSKFDLTLFVNEQLGGDLELVFECNAEIEPWIIGQMASHLERLLHEVVRRPQVSTNELSLYSAEMKQVFAKDWYGKKVDSGLWNSTHELILSHVASRGETTAAIFGESRLSYTELDHWADQIANELKVAGVKPNQFVGLFTPRSLEMVAGILGILKAGAAYLPLDPDYPQDRLDFMLSDTKSKVVLCHPEVKNQLSVNDRTCLSLQYDPLYQSTSPVNFVNQLEDFAYIIYTSGSTGKPKGVPVTHGNLLHSTTARFDFFEEEMHSFLLLSSFSFDSSVAGIFWALCSGGTLVLPPKRIEQDIVSLTEIIYKEKVSHTLMLPSLYQVLLNFAKRDKLESLKAVIVAGEACSSLLKESHFQKLSATRLYNEYGPTEASVWCIAHEIKLEDKGVPIGRPIQNSAAYILDSQGNRVPTGISGELHIGGPGVTKGYLNRQELTKERFLPDQFAGNGKMYRTGDLARFGKDGVIYFLGRADDQVKIRGFRVELEEIRATILKEPIISEAVVKVLIDASGNKQLAAWVQSDKAHIVSTLRSQLKKALPGYMVPVQIAVMQELPKLPNGKVDGSQLDASTIERELSHSILLPTSEKEKILWSIWKDVLNLEQLGTQDNFFDIGGDSILSIQIVAKTRQSGLKISPTDIFKYQSIQELAVAVSFVDQSKEYRQITRENYPIEFPLSFQQEAFLLHSLQAKNDQGFLQLQFKITGSIDPHIMKEAWQKATILHPVLRTSFHWKDVDSPYQVIHETVDVLWHFLDLSVQNSNEQLGLVAKFKETDRGQGLDLSMPGGGRFTLIRTNEKDYLLCWTCHHILVDGWSAAIIFKEVLQLYSSLLNSTASDLLPVPNYKRFLDWKSDLNLSAARGFWQKMMEGEPAPLFSEFAEKSFASKEIKDITVVASTEAVDSLYRKAQQERVTVNTILQGLWLLTLSSFFGKKQVSTGFTVTGRSVDFPEIDRITGLFMNVLPFKENIPYGSTLAVWFGELQSKVNELKPFEHTDLDQIQPQGAWEGRELFDNLFVFGNFLSEKFIVDELEVEEFKGDFSATYPLTLRINPTSDFEINCRFNSAIISDAAASWLIENFKAQIEVLVNTDLKETIIQSILSKQPIHLLNKVEEVAQTQVKKVTQFSGTENAIQLSLLKLWEKILGAQLIGIHDNYFQLGGTSLGAMRLFSEIEDAFGKKLSPTVLISHPTISELATLLSDDSQEENWSSIIPMKTSGNQHPLFCLHSGGAHVLFYQGLAKYMSPDRPVYAIQPTGIDGEEEKHKDIAEMAQHYIHEMKKVQPQGPYHLIGTCFGNAVGMEMAHQLKVLGEPMAVLVIVDSAPAYLQPPSPNGERKPVSRMMAMVKEGNWRAITKKFRNRYIRLGKKINASNRTEQEKELDEMVGSLNEVYAGYSWKPIEDPLVFIRSTEFSVRKDKKFHLERWQHLTSGKLEVSEVEGHHLTLFEEPEVEGLVRAIEEYLPQKEVLL